MTNGERLKYLREKNGYTQKDIYEWGIPVSSACNELCCGVGFTTYGYSNVNSKVSMIEIEEILNDFNNSPMTNPQIILQIKSLPKSIMIIEINAIDEDPLPFDAIDRIALFTAKLSQEYNVLGLAIAIDKKENCKLLDAIYQRNNEPYYTQLHLPKTVLTAHEYIDIMSRL